ncbi:MAG TPA: hypothetical protein VL201_04450 [Patescibacteria group bacterium]|jgi:hypothetical protein|nr:hypothetical protein [Patescibacteria group bacterium]
MLSSQITRMILVYSACLVSSAYCWNNVIQNDTNGEIVVTIDYAAPGICSPENRILQAHSQVNIDSKVCCAQKVTIRASSGTTKGQTYSLDTPRAGLDMTCAHFYVRVYIATGNILMAEAHLT